MCLQPATWRSPTASHEGIVAVLSRKPGRLTVLHANYPPCQGHFYYLVAPNFGQVPFQLPLLIRHGHFSYTIF